jgi:2-dehydro-3-deoxyphosphooctonate aldolase (KDO 8-P synthase)
MESLELMQEVAMHCSSITSKLGFNYIFKSSFDKANRSNLKSYRGPGFETGLEWLSRISSEFNVQTTTDIHETWQAAPAAQVIDMLQIPALLSRQTDLIAACANQGKKLNIKKGQWMSPYDIPNVIEKAKSGNSTEIIITERGTTFGYNDLVVDFRSLAAMKSMGASLGFDGTHSVQQPTANGKDSGGQPKMIPYLTRAAATFGIDYLFLETHPNPEQALSDGACMLNLDNFENLLTQVKNIVMASSAI